MPTVLVIDDDPDSLGALIDWCEGEGADTRAARSLAEARALLDEDGRIDLVLVDQELGDGSGLDLLPLLEDRHELEVVLLTSDADVESAVAAFRRGAIDYLQKPVDLARLRHILADATRTADLRDEVIGLRDELRSLGRFGRMVGSSPRMHEVYDLIMRVAPTDASVLIMGETGTGKELVAETVHALSRRAKRPFVPVNCGAIPESLIESELFGHEKGAFTGASKQHEGFFERAHGGTLFLDEITEMPIDLQVKLLRSLESGTVRRVGGHEILEVDVRVIAATNRDPHEAVKDERLREDLLYRLLVFPIEVPPLRERGDDVETLAEAFLNDFNRQSDRPPLRLADDAREALLAHRWPGNIRELKHAIEGACIRATDRVRARDLAFVDMRSAPPQGDPSSLAPTPASEGFPRVGQTIAEMEKELILATLEKTGDDKKAAAPMLGISLKTLYNRLRRYREEED